MRQNNKDMHMTTTAKLCVGVPVSAYSILRLFWFVALSKSTADPPHITPPNKTAYHLKALSNL